MRSISRMLFVGMFLLIAELVPSWACMVRSIEPNEVQVVLTRVASKINLRQVKAALGPGYFSQTGKGVAFRCVDGSDGDIVLNETDLSLLSREALDPSLMAQVVERHLFWLKMIDAIDIDPEHIRKIAARINAENRSGGYFLAYAHEDPFVEAGNCVEKVLGRTSPCKDSCINATLYPEKCDRACHDRIKQSRIDCFLTCDPAVRPCYEAATVDEWKVLGRASVVNEGGVTYMLRCHGGSGLRDGVTFPGKAIDALDALESFMDKQR